MTENELPRTTEEIQWRLPLREMPRISFSPQTTARLSRRRPMSFSLRSLAPPLALDQAAGVSPELANGTLPTTTPPSTVVSKLAVNFSSNDDSSDSRILYDHTQLIPPNVDEEVSADDSHSPSNSSSQGSLPIGNSYSTALPASTVPSFVDHRPFISKTDVESDDSLLEDLEYKLTSMPLAAACDLDSSDADKICSHPNIFEATQNRTDDANNIGVDLEDSSITREAGEINSSVHGELILEEGELEEGQLQGEWSGLMESQEVDYPSSFQIGEDDEDLCTGLGQTSMVHDEDADAASQLYFSSQDEQMYWRQDMPEKFCIPSKVDVMDSRQERRGKKKIKVTTVSTVNIKKKHKKGGGCRKRARERSRDACTQFSKKRSAEGNRVNDVSNNPAVKLEKGTTEPGELSQNGINISNIKVPEVVPETAAVEEGPEDGEILLEPAKICNGPLTSLVEAEVGLWTTDDVDDQLLTQMEEDAALKKKRGPETAERKLKRKIAKRKKRAQKERELGIRRPPRTVQSKPFKVLCTHYMKGRCAKGDKCTFSHDGIPLTKQELDLQGPLTRPTNSETHLSLSVGNLQRVSSIRMQGEDPVQSILEPCKFLMSHSCLKGDDCLYSHDLGAFPCKFFHTRGLCYDGANCQFSHGAISEEAMEKLQKRVEKEKKDRAFVSASVDGTPFFSAPLPPDLDPDPLGWNTPSSYSTYECPPDLDPDPLGWGTSRSYSTCEGAVYPNPSNLDEASHGYDELSCENFITEQSSMIISPGQSTVCLSSSVGIELNESDAIMQLRREEPFAKSVDLTPCQSTVSLSSLVDIECNESDAATQLRRDETLAKCMAFLADEVAVPGSGRFKRDAESLFPFGREGPSSSPMSHLPSERRKVSRTEGTSMEKSGQDSLKNESESCLEGMLSPFCSLLSRTFAGSKRREPGNRVLQDEKALQSPTLSTADRQQTVEYLLGEALRD